MPIRKYGTEPARTETRVEDNDPETLESVKKQGQDSKSGRGESSSSFILAVAG